MIHFFFPPVEVELDAFDKTAITNPAGYKGITGLFRFLPDGSNQHTMAVYEIKSDGLIEIDPAPSTFIGMYRDGMGS